MCEYTLEDFQLEESNLNLNYVYGRQKEKELLLSALGDESFDSLLYLASCSMYLLTGPSGVGKAHLAYCFARDLQLNAGFYVYQIDCEDIMDEEKPELIWEVLLDALIARSDPEGEEGENLCLYLENLRAVKEQHKSVKIITKKLKALKTRKCRCIILATDTTGDEIPTSILKQFTIMELENPNEDERTNVFQQNLSFEVSGFDVETEEEISLMFFPIDISADKNGGDTSAAGMKGELQRIAMYCAENTEGFSFAQLEQVIVLLSKRLKMNLKTVTDNDAEVIIDHIKQGQKTNEKSYIVEEEDFLSIIAQVRKAGEILKRADESEHNKNKEGSGTVVVNQTQSSMDMKMLEKMFSALAANMNVGGGGRSAAVSAPTAQSGFTEEDEARQRLLEAADGKNPEVKAVVAAYETIPNLENIDAYVESV